MESLQPRDICAKGEVPIAYLKGRRFRARIAANVEALNDCPPRYSCIGVGADEEKRQQEL